VPLYVLGIGLKVSVVGVHVLMNSFERTCRVGQNHSVYTVFLAGTSPDIRSYTVYIYGSGQP
jgi:hypothetical protein